MRVIRNCKPEKFDKKEKFEFLKSITLNTANER